MSLPPPGTLFEEPNTYLLFISNVPFLSSQHETLISVCGSPLQVLNLEPPSSKQQRYDEYTEDLIEFSDWVMT